MNVVVVGGTGTVGSEVVRALLARGTRVKVRVLTRTAEKSGLLPRGAEAAVGDLRRPASLPRLFRGADAVFVLNAVSPDETSQGLAAVQAARNAGARRIVYLSVQGVENEPGVPFIAAKIPVERAVRETGLEWTILRPNSFFQNDLPARESILQHGVYPHPIGAVGVSAVDVRDIAAAAANALCESGFEGRIFPIAGPEPLTGEAAARIYSEHLGRPVRYCGDDLDAWAGTVHGALPDWIIDALRSMYAHLQRHGLIATAADLASTREILGSAPRSFESFVAGIAPAWRLAAAGR